MNYYEVFHQFCNQPSPPHRGHICAHGGAPRRAGGRRAVFHAQVLGQRADADAPDQHIPSRGNEDPAKLQAFLMDAKKALQGNSYEDLQTIIGNFTDTGYTDVSFWDTYGE